MRCVACDCILTDFEATRKSAASGEYLDMCERCFQHIKGCFDVIEREDLRGPVLPDEDKLFEDEEEEP